jgi:putative Mn2+ efflux pump MntP
MDLIPLIILAIGLSMDSLAISLTSGAIIKDHQVINVLKIAGMLAFIQTALTIAGWYIGSTFVNYINRYDHWIAFAILVFIGGKVIIEALDKKKESVSFNPLNIKVMFSLSIAASIDASAVGLSLSMVDHPILTPAVIIGVVTFIVSSLGVIMGCKIGRRYNSCINLIGGIILILIGCSILLDHTLLSDGQYSSLLH